MSDSTAGRFRILVQERFRFLEGHGFRRSRADELDSPTAASVVYVGAHLGFVISHDVRDAQVDVRMARVRGGRLVGPGAGGYSLDLLSHLVEHAGYRGGRTPAGAAAAGDALGALERQVGWWADLLANEGTALLADPPGVLPEE